MEELKTAVATEWSVVHSPAAYKTVVGIEVALTKPYTRPACNQSGKAVLELCSHAQNALINSVTNAGTTGMEATTC